MSVVLFILELMFFCVIALIILVAATEREKKKERERREKAFRCKQAVKTGDCPKDCSMCEWGSYDD